MKEYIHKKTKQKAIERVGGRYYLLGIPNIGIDPNMIENTLDWRLVIKELTEEEKALPLLSFNDVMELSSQNDHYREFTTSWLEQKTKDKLNKKEVINNTFLYSCAQIDIAWHKAKAYLYYNITGVRNLNVEQIIGTFKKHFHHFLNEKNV